MPYDYQLVIGTIILGFSLVGILGDLAESRSPIRSLIAVAVGCGLIYWAWDLSGETLTIYSVPEALFRVISQFR